MLTTWHARAITALVAVAALLGAYGAGRETAPAKVVTRDVVRVEVQTRDVVRTQVVRDVAKATDVQADVRTVTVTRWLPGAPAAAGCPAAPAAVEQTVTREAAMSTHATQSSETKATAAAEHDAHQVAQETRTVTVTADRPQWAVTGLAGASLGSPPRLVPGLPGPLVVGAAVDRRILGPLSAGLWATSSGAGGVSVRLEF